MKEAISNISTGLAPGTVVGQYRISEVIGEGAIAKVYKARQLNLDRDVAIKFLCRREEWDDEVVELFEQEAKTIARLNHPNIVQVIDCGTHEGDYYFVLEYVDGTDFKQILKNGNQDLPRKLDTVVQALRGLDYAHKNGIVHRDIKPANLLVSTSEQVKIADFGIAVVADKGKMTDTDSANIMGTPAYMAPEQWDEHKSVDRRADIYAVGVMLYEILTGKRPEKSHSVPSALCSDSNPELDEIVMRCLEPDPDQRYQTAAEVKDALLSAISGQKMPDGNLSGSDVSSQASLGGSDKFVHVDTLSETQFGATYLMKNTRNNSLYVIKKLCRETAGIKEARILSKLTHPNVIKIYGAGVDSKKGILITEYAQGGSLAERLVKPFPLREALEIFKQIAAGLCFAHKNSIVHGNLRPSNILFDAKGTVKIADFALPEHYLRKRTNWYASPERERSIASDIYAAGIILYQLLTTKIAEVRPNGELAWISRSTDARFQILNLVSRMLESDPVKRPRSFDEILRLSSEISFVVTAKAEAIVSDETSGGAAVG